MKHILMIVFLGTWQAMAYAATSCIIVTNGEAKIQAQDQEFTTPLRLENCEGAKVLEGDVSVCFLNDKASRICRKMKAGDAFNSKLLSANQNSDFGAFRATIASLFKGDTQSRIGQTRDTPPYPEFPNKQVLLPTGDMVIHLQPPRRDKVVTFSLTVAGGQVPAVTVTAADGRLHIPANVLSRGREYRWEALGEKIRFDGKFKLASEKEAKHMAAVTSATATDTALDEIGRRVLLAEIYLEHGYAFDAESLILALGVSRSQ